MKRQQQRGIALIMVVCTVLVLTLMAEHLQVTTILLSDEALVTCSRLYLRYAGESAAERGFWCYLCHTTAVPDPANPTPAASTITHLLHGSYGSDYQFQYRSDRQGANLAEVNTPEENAGTFAFAVTFHDISRGSAWDFSQPTALESQRERLKRMLQASLGNEKVSLMDQLQAVDEVYDLVIDYADADDAPHMHGREKYDDPGLPRNGPLQYREEIYWLDLPRNILNYEGMNDLATPAKMAFIPPNRRPMSTLNFFSAEAQDLLNVSECTPPLTRGDIQAILSGRQQYLQHLRSQPSPWQPIDTFMQGTRFAEIRNRVNLNIRSQVVEITVTAKDPLQGIARTLTWVRENPLMLRSGNLSGPNLVYWYRLL